jgi:hypothetical protein
MDVRVGDKVHVLAEVFHEFGDGSVQVSMPGVMAPFRISKSNIVHVEPRPLAVGDRVVYEGPVLPWEGKILAIHNEFAWVDFKFKPDPSCMNLGYAKACRNLIGE